VKVYFVSKALIRRNQSVTWVRLSNRNSRTVTKSGIVLVDMASLMIPRLYKLSFLLKLILFLLKKQVRIVFIDCWLFFRGSISLLLLFQTMMKLLKIKIIYDARDPFPEYEIASRRLNEEAFRTRLLRLLSGIAYGLTDAVLVPSNEYKKFLEKNYHIKTSKIYPIYRGTDIEIFNPKAGGLKIRTKLRLENKFIVGWFGIMSTVHNVNEILLPLIKVASQNMQDITFLIGGKGLLKNDIIKLLRKNQDLPVLFLGYIPYNELPNYIASCDVTLCPVDNSTVHGRFTLPIKISESLATGVPVVATRTPAAVNYFRYFKSIRFVNNTVEDFMNGLLEIRSNVKKYKSSAIEESTRASELSLQEACRKISDIILALQVSPSQ
jgi:glycosyltransferase involved in cell wall biosynthesis